MVVPSVVEQMEPASAFRTNGKSPAKIKQRQSASANIEKKFASSKLSTLVVRHST
jgi:hypothetical protein